MRVLLLLFLCLARPLDEILFYRIYMACYPRYSQIGRFQRGMALLFCFFSYNTGTGISFPLVKNLIVNNFFEFSRG